MGFVGFVGFGGFGDGGPGARRVATSPPKLGAMSSVIDCSGPDRLAEGVRFAAAALRRGEIVVLPTDTVYGVGADAFDAQAVRALLEAKGRGRDVPPPVLVPAPRTLDGLAMAVPDYARALVDEFWPGPLTLVLQAQTSLMWDLGETNGTVAVRMPDDEVALALLAETGPLAVSSANTHGGPPAMTVQEAREQLGDEVAVYLDGGPARGGVPSTIVDCTGQAPRLLRSGAIPDDDVLAVAPAAPQDADPAAAADEAPEAATRAAIGSTPESPVAAPESTPETTPDAAPERGDAGARPDQPSA